MKKVLVFLLACFTCTSMFAQMWTVDATDCAGSNCYIYGKLHINGEYAGNTENLQLAAFDQDDICRGVSGTIRSYNGQYFYYAITCKGNDEIYYTNIKVWDTDTDSERTDLTFELPADYPDGFHYVGLKKYGKSSAPLDLNFIQETTGITMDILGYEESGEDHWYLISSPIGAIEDATSVTNLLEGEYDFYYFDQTGGDDGLEWKNYKVSEFGFEVGKGYLYANQNNTTLTFNGTAYTDNGTFDLAYEEDCEDSNMKGWNLMGNPYNANATVDKDAFLVMVGAALVPNTSTVVAPMQGILIKAEGTDEQVTFTPQETGDKKALFVLNLTSESKLVDRAVVRFDQGRQLPKIQIFKNTKLYIPVDGENYAMVRSEGVGEIPVNFKAEKNGNYTISINSENVSFGYLHLIDNMTGADIDLLANPNYSFEANTTDYASRFKLVFATANDEDNFAFFSNGSLVVSNEGNATLQVIDVTGRIIKCETINGCASVNVDAASGVYMIRLVNGDNVKVQKVVK